MRLSLALGFALLLAGGVNSLLAQHSGGGHSSSGGHSSFSSGFHARSASPGPHSSYPTYSVPTGDSGINRGALPTGPYRTGRVGRVYRGGYYLAPYSYYPYYPLFNDYDDSGYYDGPYQGYAEPDPAAQTTNVTTSLLGEQVDRLSAEVEALRNEREQGNSVPMPRPRYNAPPMMPDDPPPSAPVTLILRDGKHLQVNSYAVMGQEIWDFSMQPAKKIALANVDLAASQKATEASGGEFPEIR